MAKWMTDCVREAPPICANMLKNRETIVSKAVDLFTAKKYSKIVLVGSGSSSNIANSSKYAIEKFLNVDCEVVTPIAFTEYDYKFNENSFIFCLSQSGRSTNTIAALERAQECGYDCAGISLDVNSPLKNHCKNVLEYGSYTGEKDVYVCRYFSASILFFVMFALEAGLKLGTITKEDHKKYVKQLDNVVAEMPKVIDRVEKFYNDNKEQIHSMKRVMAMGIGPLFGLTNEACLKFSETTGISTNGYEVEEFLHGPAYEVKKDHALFFLDGDDIMHDRITSIYEAVHELTDRVFLITYSGITGKSIININADCDPVMRPISYVIPFQLIPGKICEDLNIRAVTIYNYRTSRKVATKTDK